MNINTINNFILMIAVVLMALNCYFIWNNLEDIRLEIEIIKQEK